MNKQLVLIFVGFLGFAFSSGAEHELRSLGNDIFDDPTSFEERTKRLTDKDLNYVRIHLLGRGIASPSWKHKNASFYERILSEVRAANTTTEIVREQLSNLPGDSRKRQQAFQRAGVIGTEDVAKAVAPYLYDETYNGEAELEKLLNSGDPNAIKQVQDRLHNLSLAPRNSIMAAQALASMELPNAPIPEKSIWQYRDDELEIWKVWSAENLGVADPSQGSREGGEKQYPELSSEAANATERPESETNQPPPPSENQSDEDASPIWPYVLVAVALVGIVGILLRSRKGNPDH